MPSAQPRLFDLYCATVASTPRVALEGAMRMFNETSIVEQVQQTRVPTLVICPTADALISPAYVRQGTLALIPGARLAYWIAATKPRSSDLRRRRG